MNYQAVLFDLGGVLINLRGVASMREWTGMETEEEIYRRWLACPWVRSFERGRCAAHEFAAGVVKEWDLGVSPARFLDAFTSWPDALLDGATDLVAATRRRVAVGCVSNTNAVHWNVLSGWGLDSMFDYRFLSHELDLIKPDAELFEHVISVVGVDPSRVLFLDDNALNVEQALRSGLAAVQVRGVEEARAALIAAGVIDPVPEPPGTATGPR